MNLARTFLDDLRFGPLGARFRDELTVDKGSRESSERRLYEDENLVESFSASSSSWLVLQLEVEDLSSLLFRIFSSHLPALAPALLAHARRDGRHLIWGVPEVEELRPAHPGARPALGALPAGAHEHLDLLHVRRAHLPQGGGRLRGHRVSLLQLRELLRTRHQEPSMVHVLFYCELPCPWSLATTFRGFRRQVRFGSAS